MEGVAMKDFWQDRSVFISGATGLLGSWLAEALLDQGARVICLVRDWVPESRAVSNGVLQRSVVVRGELEDYAVVLRVLNEYEVDSVFHLGAQTIVGTASRSPLSTFESNLRGTWTLLEAVRQCARSIERVVVASSDKAYGEHSVLPYREDTPLQGRFPYDASKACADLIALSFAHTYDLPIAVTRCGNLFGGGDLNYNRLIPGTIRSVLMNERPVIRSDGSFVRDYFYVRDAVSAYMDLAERLPGEGFSGEAFNFGNETPLSVLDVVGRIVAALGQPELTPIILNEAVHEIPQQYLDCTKARTSLGWRPQYAFEDALKETLGWYRDVLLPRESA